MFLICENLLLAFSHCLLDMEGGSLLAGIRGGSTVATVM